MAKQHELLAVNNSFRNQANTCLADIKKLFTDKQGHFTSRKVETHSTVEGIPDTVDEQIELQTTVTKELKWLAGFAIKAVDADHHVNLGDMKATADVVLEDGVVLLKNVPALTLLQMEKTATEWKNVASAIPTLDPAKGFTPAPDVGPGVSKSRVITRITTAKRNKPIVLHGPTVEHPAQTQMVIEDLPVGTKVTQEWSSMITPAEKADTINRCEILIRAIKRARSKANDIEVEIKPEHNIGKTLWEFAFPTTK